MALKPNFLKVIYMNVVLTLHLSLCLSIISLLPEIARQNKYTYLGNISIIFIYVSELLVDVIGPIYLKHLSFKLGFTIQAIMAVPSFFTAYYLTNCINEPGTNTLCQVKYLTPISLAGTFLLGIGIGGYFIIQNFYVSKCCIAPNSHDLFFSTTYVLMGVAFLLSGLFGELGIKYFGRDNYFLYAGFAAIILSLCFLLVKQPREELITARQSMTQQVTNIQNNTQVIDQAYIDEITEEDDLIETKNMMDNIRDIIDQVKNKDLLLLYPLFLASGVVMGYEYGFLYEFITKTLADQDLPEEIINQKTGRIFLYGGIGQILAPIINNFVKLFISNKQYTVIYANLLGIIMFMSYYNDYYLSYYLLAVIEFLLAFCDITGQLISSITISEEFNDAMSVYGIYFFSQNLAIALCAMAGMFFGQSIIYNLLIVNTFQIAVLFSSQIDLRKQIIKKQLQID